MLQFEKTIEMNATYAFYLPPFRQKETGISKQMEMPVKSESIYYEFHRKNCWNDN